MEEANGEWRIAHRLRAAVLLAIRHSLFALFLLSPAFARTELAKIPAHPALWTVHSPTATLYLFGSIHLLPANLDWHTPAIDRAMAQSATFVFEAPLDDAGKAAVADFVRKHGALSPGQSLRAMIPAASRADYDDALAADHYQAAQLDGMRPWLASLMIDVGYLQQMHYMVANGVDQQVYAYATAQSRTVRTLETVDQQLNLFMPTDEKLEMDEFATDLKQFRTINVDIGAMLDAWGAGNPKEVGRVINKELDAHPDVRKVLLDDRNKAWVVQLDAMLAGKGTIFVTVGTGHLVGRNGVPSLLRAQHYRVEGP
jgi:uncharacterized protein YbaP (TraB family)